MTAWLLIWTLGRPARADETEAMKAQLATCREMESNRQRALRVSADPTPAACRAQIEASLRACLKNPNATDEDQKGALSELEVSTMDLNVLSQRQIATFTAGRQRFVDAAGTCDAEKKAVDRACDESREELKKTLRARPADAESRDLQLRLSAAAKARAAADDAIIKTNHCFIYQADAYQSGITKAQTQLAEISTSADSNVTETNLVRPASFGGEESPAPAPAVVEATKPPVSYASLSGRGGEAAVTALGVVGGKVGAPVNAVISGETGDYLGAAQNTAGTAARFVDSRALGLLGGLPGAVAVQVMSSSPAGSACNADVRDPAAAATAGCAANINAGRAIGILRGP